MINYTELSAKQIDAAYINSLTDLIIACRHHHIEINEVYHYQNGWKVTFKGYEGDAICHDGSYGSPCLRGRDNPINDWTRSGSWETFGFPWDYDDVSVHTAEELAFYLESLNKDESPWEEDEDC